MNTDSTPPVARDASDRAFRTLMQGLGVSVAAAVVAALVVGLAPGIEWTTRYWTTLGLGVANAGIMSIVSYFARILVPPAGRDS